MPLRDHVPGDLGRNVFHPTAMRRKEVCYENDTHPGMFTNENQDASNTARQDRAQGGM